MGDWTHKYEEENVQEIAEFKARGSVFEASLHVKSEVSPNFDLLK